MARIPLNRTITQNTSLLLLPNEQLLGKNLGENGTGIRRISTTQVPVMNSTTVTLPPIKVPSEGRDRLEIPLSTADYEESMELPDVDDDHLNQTLRQHNISIVKNVRNIFYYHHILCSFISFLIVGHSYVLQ